MADKVTLLSSIKKLLALNVSDDEIMANLEEVGIDKTEAKMLLKEAKEKVPEKIKTEEKKPEIKPKKEEPVIEKKEVKQGKGIPDETRKELIQAIKGTPERKKPKEKPEIKKPAKKLHTEEKEVWEKGVLTVINERLDEIESIRNNINEVIDGKVREELNKETKKMEEIMESQKELLNDKINSSLEAKAKEITAGIDAKLTALKELKVSISETSEKAEEKEEKNEKVLAEINAKLKDVEISKLGLVKALKNEVEEIKNESKQFMFDSAKQIEELDGRVNKALELESKITEGLITNAEKKIEEISERQTEAVSSQLTKKLSAFEELTKRMDPKRTEENIRKLSADFEVKISNTIREKETEIDEVIAAKIKEIEIIKKKMELESPARKLAEEVNMKMDAFRLSMQKELDESVQELENTKFELKKFIALQLAETSTNSEEQLNELFEQRKKELSGFERKIIKNTNLKEITQKVEELDVFKDQFVKTIRKNLDEMKTDKEELEVMVEEKEKELSKRINEIDLKIRELDEFEKTFAREMGVKIEQLTKAKTLKEEVKELERKEKSKTIKPAKKAFKEKKVKSSKVLFKDKKGKSVSGVRGVR